MMGPGYSFESDLIHIWSQMRCGRELFTLLGDLDQGTLDFLMKRFEVSRWNKPRAWGLADMSRLP